MLKRLRVDNFKSLINVVFEPTGVNLLTGRNNSGKTTVCQAMKFLAASSYLPLTDAVWLATNDISGLTNAYLHKDAVSFECECELLIDNEPYRFAYSLSFTLSPQPKTGALHREFSVDEEKLTVDGGKFGEETPILTNKSGDVRLLHEGRHFQKAADTYVDTSAPTDATMLSRLYDLQHNRFANAFKRYLNNWVYYNLDPAKLRSGEAKQQSGLVLQIDGSNLSYALFLLKSFDETRYRTLVKIVQEIEPKLEALNFVPPTQESVYMDLTDKHGNRFPIVSISDGTLRFMAMTYIMLVTPMLAQAGQTGQPVVMIEEPENGVYVGHLKRLMELVEPDVSPSPQYVFSTHSPYFIDLFDRYLDGVFVMKSHGTHCDIVKPGADRLGSLLENFDLGEAHFQELLAL